MWRSAAGSWRRVVGAGSAGVAGAYTDRGDQAEAGLVALVLALATPEPVLVVGAGELAAGAVHDAASHTPPWPSPRAVPVACGRSAGGGKNRCVSPLQAACVHPAIVGELAMEERSLPRPWNPLVRDCQPCRSSMLHRPPEHAQSSHATARLRRRLIAVVNCSSASEFARRRPTVRTASRCARRRRRSDRRRRSVVSHAVIHRTWRAADVPVPEEAPVLQRLDRVRAGSIGNRLFTCGGCVVAARRGCRRWLGTGACPSRWRAAARRIHRSSCEQGVELGGDEAHLRRQLVDLLADVHRPLGERRVQEHDRFTAGQAGLGAAEADHVDAGVDGERCAAPRRCHRALRWRWRCGHRRGARSCPSGGPCRTARRSRRRCTRCRARCSG